MPSQVYESERVFMNLKFIKRGIIIATVVCAISIPVQQIAAAELIEMRKQDNVSEVAKTSLLDAVAEIQKQENREIKIETSEEIEFNGKLSGKVFANTADEYVLVLTAPETGSDWAGKIYANSVVEIVEKDLEWTEIVSGNVTGYVRTESLIIGRDALDRAKGMLTTAYPDRELLTLTEDEIESVFTVAESRQEEEVRIAAEEAARKAAEEARIAAEKEALRQKGQAVVDYAMQFKGNPYVYGGNSLTNGTDCSGFVKGVYAHFGISLPRTSYAMRSVGRSVSFSEIQPGDIVCYEGHVAIYAGNGKNINAIDEAHGIGLSNTKYRRIVTIRRMF